MPLVFPTALYWRRTSSVRLLWVVASPAPLDTGCMNSGSQV
jgi:hypothetical protein